MFERALGYHNKVCDFVQKNQISTKLAALGYFYLRDIM